MNPFIEKKEILWKEIEFHKKEANKKTEEMNIIAKAICTHTYADGKDAIIHLDHTSFCSVCFSYTH